MSIVGTQRPILISVIGRRFLIVNWMVHSRQDTWATSRVDEMCNQYNGGWASSIDESVVPGPV